jgi:hypothetical protein
VAAAVYTQEFTISGLLAGKTYRFKIQAHNAIGFSADSLPLAIIAATIPDVPASPTTAVSGDNILITWDAPYNGGSTVTGYVIKLRTVDEVTFIEDTVHCDGVNKLTIINTRSCQVPISVLIVEPYNLPWGSSIYANVKAFNIIGESGTSDAGNGALIVIAPDAPINLQNVAAQTNAY